MFELEFGWEVGEEVWEVIIRIRVIIMIIIMIMNEINYVYVKKKINFLKKYSNSFS